MYDWFNTRKAAQVAAFFCEKQGGDIPVLKLVKLIYLADRHFMSECGFPITNDQHVSMQHGPVNSITYDLIGGGVEVGDWSDLISDREGHVVGLARDLTDDDKDELSDAELDALEAVWNDFGSMTKYAIRDWTHKNCTEWEDTNGSSIPIPLERTLRFLDVDEAEKFSQRQAVYREFRSAINELEENFADQAW